MATKRSDLELLAEELARLSPEERDQVFKSAADKSRSSVPAPATVWERVRAIKGIVHLGGNAVEDGERLYDV